MEKSKNSLGIIIALTVLIVAALAAIYIFFIKPTSSEDLTTEPQSSYELTEDNFTLNAQYIGEDTWEYSVTGTIPTPCHEFVVTPQVMESFPEQVNVVVSVIEDPEAMCIQVIEEVQESGEFSASENAEMSFAVNYLSRDSLGD